MVELLAAAVLIGMVCHRVWRIIAKDSITEPLRAPLIARTSLVPAARWVHELIDCPFCLGFWLNMTAALIAGGVYDWAPTETVLVWFAGSTVTGVVGRQD